jgi:alanyl-tRNA synthetase
VTERWTGNEIRKTFLRFFEERGHRVVRSSSLVPANDPTLLFTNAGMNQFKDVFLGLEHRDYNRATSCQKCVRAGGKHNDLENVGFTNRHHTFFEMLGNFSFGDYFKNDAIAYAWELVTSPQWFGIPLDKLYFTVFGGAEISPGTTLPPDDHGALLWTQIGAPKDRVVEVPGLKENFWQMGDTGPCGPCSEIFYDMGPAASDQGHPDCKFPCDCGRYVEIWNLVFMQFNRDSSGKLNPLPKPSVDTGMGLERVAAVLQGVISNYDTDLFHPLIAYACLHTRATYGSDPRQTAALRVVADHARAATFLVADGLIPSNEGRNYVLRKIIRRACDFGREISLKEPFLFEMADLVVELMTEPYPALAESKQRIAATIKSEESKYIRLILPAEEQLIKRVESRPLISADDPSAIHETGRELGVYTEQQIEKAKRKCETPEGRRLLHGRDFFYAYSTLGLRPDHVRDLAVARGWFIPEGEEPKFESLMDAERERGKASWKGAHKEAASPVYLKLRETFKTEPDFYFGTRARDARVEAIVTKEGAVNEIPRGSEAEIVLDRTTIYAESGGQVADTGALYDNSESLEVAEVRGAYYPVSGLIAHRIVAKENLRVGDRVATLADPERRIRDMRNHTATHLVHAALRNILGTHVKQAGSLVAPDHLRFDFSHFTAVDTSELSEIEQQVNEEILKNLELRTDIMNIDDALASGALAFFGDKYPEANVRVVTIPDSSSPRGFYSKELCGGTHVARTGEIGVFKIVAEQSTAAGVRRIEAISGDRGLAEYQRALTTLRDAAALLNTSEDSLVDAISRQLESAKQLEKQLEALRRKSAGSQAQDLLESARSINGVRVVAAQVSGVDRDNLRQMADVLRQKMGSGVVVLFSADDGKVALITAVTKDLTPKLHAGKIVQELAKLVGGSGGGRPDLAEAGGKDASGIDKALSSVYPLLERLL